MNESDNQYADNKTGLSDAAREERKNDIYERFLKDIQNIGNGAGAVNSEKSNASDRQPTYEPLNEEELLFFVDGEAEFDTEDDHISMNTESLVITQDDTPIQENTPNTIIAKAKDTVIKNKVITESISEPIPEPLSNNQKPSAKDNKKGVKLLIVGSLCGVLLIVVAITLSATGMLADLTDSSETASAPVVNNEQVIKADTADDADDANLAIVAEEVKPITNENIQATVAQKEISAPTPTAVAKEVLVVPAEPAIIKNNSEIKDDIETKTKTNNEDQAAISFEDFQREAQSTLYRDSKD